MNRRLTLLGSTGSIGTQALEVARKLGLEVSVLAARRNTKLLEEQIREFNPKLVCVVDADAARSLRISTADIGVRIVEGEEGLLEAAAYEESDIILNSVVGMVGLKPTLAALKTGKRLALANKETLVAGGSLVMQSVKEHGTELLPVDSEHSAIFQSLQGEPGRRALKRILLTASGGPFFGRTRAELESITPEQALKHPNWSMGAKVTIDSATLMNKGLEVIEAAWLFDVTPDEIEVLIHRESIVHSAVEYVDNSVIAQLGVPDMRIPIQYAISYPERAQSPAKQLDLFETGKLTFFRPDTETFCCLEACRKALKRGGLAPAAANGANEKAVELFLHGKLSFLRIGELVTLAMENQKDVSSYTVADVLDADAAAKEFVMSKAL